MEIVELSVIQPGPGLNDLIYRLAERMGGERYGHEC